jgi:hypothetical protein
MLLTTITRRKRDMPIVIIPAVKNLTLEDLVHPKVDTPKMIPNRATLLTSLAIKRDTKMQ